VTVGGMPAATIMDFAPIKNIPTFEVCQSPTNPAVIAAMGSPVPCVPAIVAPWTPGSLTVTIGGLKALTNTSTCTCTLGGVITITSAGQETTTVP
jgi:hypothetical protein